MKFRFSLIALVIAVSLPALATSGITPVGGEAGSTTHAMPSTKSRADVIKELEAWKRNPVTADGWREVGGDAGWVFVGTNQSSKTRASVIAETIHAKRNPVTADGWREVGGEAGWVFVGTNNPGKTRASVIAEMIQAKRNPVTADGWLDVGGEAGAIYVGVPAGTRNAANPGMPSQARGVNVPGGLSRNCHQSAATANSHVPC